MTQKCRGPQPIHAAQSKEKVEILALRKMLVKIKVSPGTLDSR